MLAKLLGWGKKRRKLIRKFGLVGIAKITNRLKN